MTTVLLVEGASDRRAVEVLAGRLGVDLVGVEAVAMAGITNLAAHLATYAGRRVLVLHDAAESAYVARVLTRTGSCAPSFACVEDLEHELVRAVGLPGVLAVLDAAGDLTSLRRLQQQPAQRGRTELQQVRRFFGAHSGHKLKYAGLLAEAVELDAVPAPLVALLDAVRG